MRVILVRVGDRSVTLKGCARAEVSRIRRVGLGSRYIERARIQTVHEAVRGVVDERTSELQFEMGARQVMLDRLERPDRLSEPRNRPERRRRNGPYRRRG